MEAGPAGWPWSLWFWGLFKEQSMDMFDRACWFGSLVCCVFLLFSRLFGLSRKTMAIQNVVLGP